MTIEIAQDAPYWAIESGEYLHDHLASEHGRSNVLIFVDSDGSINTEIGDAVGDEPDHIISAYTPYVHKSEIVLIHGDPKETQVDAEKPTHWRSLARYECECGAEFNDRDEAVEHLQEG